MHEIERALEAIFKIHKYTFSTFTDYDILFVDITNLCSFSKYHGITIGFRPWFIICL